MSKFQFDYAINYSGYRSSQSPLTSEFPSKEEILEDLLLLHKEFYYLRIYDCSVHGHRVLEVIQENSLNFKIMLGLSLFAEENHIDHPHFYFHKKEMLDENVVKNKQRIQEVIDLSHKYSDIVSSISIGNETRSIWNNNRVSIEKLIYITTEIKSNTNKPVTFCEEYQHWISELAPLAKVVDFISLHTYPAWQGCSVETALETALKNYNEVQNLYPNKLCIITETGWPTNTHGSRIKKEDATIENQIMYNKQLNKWAKDNDTLVYLFEAFDEPWKGDNNPLEPEKHWGIYDVYRNRKK